MQWTFVFLSSASAFILVQGESNYATLDVPLSVPLSLMARSVTSCSAYVETSKRPSRVYDNAPPSSTPLAKRACTGVVEGDMQGMVWCVYLTGEQSRDIIDAIVLGQSLLESCTRVRMVACVTETTWQCPMSVHLLNFWEVMLVNPLNQPIANSSCSRKRSQGAFSKHLVWTLFNDPHDTHWRASRVCLLDANTMVRKNSDHIFFMMHPGGVMHGSVHGGVVCLTPSTIEYFNMNAFLHSEEWVCHADMASEEFLSYWFGRTERMHALPRHFNFHLHQLLLCSEWWRAPGQRTSSNFYPLLEDVDLIHVWHFSGDKEPFHCLLELKAGENIEARTTKIMQLTLDAMDSEWDQMVDGVDTGEELLSLIQNVHQRSTVEWLRCYENAWQIVFSTALQEIHRYAFSCTEQVVQCNACKLTWNCAATWRLEAHDHALFHCPVALRNIDVNVRPCLNWTPLSLTPYGDLVEEAFNYLGRVVLCWRQYESWLPPISSTGNEETTLPQWDNVASVPVPICKTPPVSPSLSSVPFPDNVPFPATPDDEGKIPDEGKNPQRRVFRNFDTAFNTLRKHIIKKTNRSIIGDRQLFMTLQNAVTAQGKFLALQ